MSKAYRRRETRANADAATIIPDASDGAATDGYLADIVGNTPKASTGLPALAQLLHRGDGWVRMVGDLDGKNLYLKYKWTGGEWRNHYVMAVVMLETLSFGLGLLLAKVQQVDIGVRRPTPDRNFDYTD